MGSATMAAAAAMVTALYAVLTAPVGVLHAEAFSSFHTQGNRPGCGTVREHYCRAARKRVFRATKCRTTSVMVVAAVTRRPRAGPVHEQDRRVVGEMGRVVGDQGPPDAAHRLRCGQVVRDVAGEQVDEPLDAELLATGGVPLDHAVGVEQHVVAGLELGPDLVRGVAHAKADAEGQVGAGVQAAHERTAAQQERLGVAGVDPGEVAGVGVELGQDRGGVRLAAETRLDGLVDVGCRCRQGVPAAAGVR